MSKIAVAVLAGVLCAGQMASAQDLKITPSQNHPVRAEAVSFEAGVAHLAAKAAFSPRSAPSQQELLGMLLFISLRGSKAHGA